MVMARLFDLGGDFMVPAARLRLVAANLPVSDPNFDKIAVV